ncbi:ly6/PLAUR domain-containing protein 2-like [Triplophysa rosa]|uniref:Lymphocyte antigen 6F-like n=1 Tax=Triplophysa rosa TaxID=992332 RepID=A0A9W7WCE8_TRIRA|nr:ly6/PLAUR domain-containing protein 2-like [Triplophysa rosa]KAI7795902.1 putative lymphocyte antigen 6F-like [Triplophysa rosa]
MDLRITIALLFILIAGGHSLQCYVCTSVLSSLCNTTETCPAGETQCSTITVSTVLGSLATKACAAACEALTIDTIVGTTSTKCCNTDLCNGADGGFKGSFLLLLCPLFFYSLCH